MDFKEYDENDAVRYIKSQVPECAACVCDELLLVIDAMFDYYDTLDDDAPDEDFEKERILSYVTKAVKRDKDTSVKVEWLPQIVQAELDYEASLLM